MEKKIIKVGFCVAYDWVMLKNSLPLVYAYADIICLSIDKHRRSWSGLNYDFDEVSFYSWIDSIDIQKKIDVYEDDFSLAELSAMENDSRQRMLMGERMGKGGWHIQIDSDEYFLDFKGFVNELKKINPNPSGNETSLNVCVFIIPLIKKITNGYLFVDFKDQVPETFPSATNMPIYHRARNNGHFNIFIPYFVIHETWARSENELWFKINNWGHSAEELNEKAKRLSYFNLWKALDEYNYQYLINFHPAISNTWPALNFSTGNSIAEFIKAFSVPKLPLSSFQFWLKNSRNASRMRHLTQQLKMFITNRRD